MNAILKKAWGWIVGVRPMSAQARGQSAETRAAAHLGEHGLKILARNVHCRHGEIDLICLERDTVVFVEVRLRTNRRYGGALESITTAKRRRIIFAARWWLAGPGRAFTAHNCRFDVVLFDDAGASQAHWIRAAFELD